MKRLSLASDRRVWAECAREVLDPSVQISNAIGYAEDLAEAVEALLAEHAHLTRLLRDVRVKNRELRRGPRIVGEPFVYVVPHDDGPAIVFADLDDADRYAEARGQGWQSEDAEVLDRKSAAVLIADELRRQAE